MSFQPDENKTIVKQEAEAENWTVDLIDGHHSKTAETKALESTASYASIVPSSVIESTKDFVNIPSAAIDDDTRSKRVLLLKAYRKFCGIPNIRERWRNIVKFMKDNGVNETAVKLSSQYRGLKHRYFRAKEARILGRGYVNFIYYDICKPHFESLSTISPDDEGKRTIKRSALLAAKSSAISRAARGKSIASTFPRSSGVSFDRNSFLSKSPDLSRPNPPTFTTSHHKIKSPNLRYDRESQEARMPALQSVFNQQSMSARPHMQIQSHFNVESNRYNSYNNDFLIKGVQSLSSVASTTCTTRPVVNEPRSQDPVPVSNNQAANIVESEESRSKQRGEKRSSSIDLSERYLRLLERADERERQLLEVLKNTTRSLDNCYTLLKRYLPDHSNN